MFSFGIILLGLIGAAIHLCAVRRGLDGKRVVEILLMYFLVFGVGVNALFGASGHIFAADAVAAKIGWPVGSPFQFEVGFGNLAWGVLGIMCIWFRGNFWLAAGLGWSVFLLGAGYVHARETLKHGNLELYNFGMILPDIVLPVILLVLLFLHRRAMARRH